MRNAPVRGVGNNLVVATHRRAWAWLGASVLCVLVCAGLLLHPMPLPWLAPFLVVSAGLAWRYPLAILPAALALLPILNFSPWTGWVLVDEFDLFMGVVLAIHLLRPRERPDARHWSSRLNWAIGLLGLSFGMSAVVGLFPLQPFGASTWGSYHSSYNSLRAVKGLLWAIALLAMAKRSAASGQPLERHIVLGMTLGLAAAAASAAYERFVFSGLFNFSDDFRITASFPEMHTGGAFAEGYFVMAIPFAVAWVVMRPTLVRIALGAMLFGAASYALAVTFARAGYLGYIGALGVMALAFVVQWLRRRAASPLRLAVVSGCVAAAGVAMIPIVTGKYMQARFATTQSDWDMRTNHWLASIDMMDEGLTTTLLGMGLGSFPRTYLFKGPLGTASATLSFQGEGDSAFVRLGSGRALYLDQRVATEPWARYTLSFDVRSADEKGVLVITLCEKKELFSYNCKWNSFEAASASGSWRRHQLTIDTERVGQGAWYARRPVVLGVHKSGGVQPIDVDNIKLLDAQGRDLVTNGDFSRGSARWFFAVDDHLPWHIKHIWVQVFFDQGLFGLLTFGLAVLAALTRGGVHLWRGELFMATLCASLCGALLVGLFDSLFDASRVMALFFFLLFLALRYRVPAVASDAARPNPNRNRPD